LVKGVRGCVLHILGSPVGKGVSKAGDRLDMLSLAYGKGAMLTALKEQGV
jgi:hypothetical protein